jgi:Na+-driven multidrug efflux pump
MLTPDDVLQMAQNTKFQAKTLIYSNVLNVSFNFLLQKHIRTEIMQTNNNQ